MDNLITTERYCTDCGYILTDADSACPECGNIVYKERRIDGRIDKIVEMLEKILTILEENG
jgi:anaerobic ribonucleoside-triphosphate reductase